MTSMRKLFSLAMTMALLSFIHPVANAQFSTVVIDDHFENGDLATGGVNGGFTLRSNGVGGTGSASESGTIATMTTTGGNNNSGIVSNTSFDAAGQPIGFRMNFDIPSVSSDPQNNGMFLGLQDDGTSFFRSTKNFGLVFSGTESRTSSGAGFGFGINDNGSGGFSSTFDDADLQLSSLQDGFMASITATLDGWEYVIDGVNDTGGSPTTFSNSNTWVASGESPTFFTDFFDNIEHVAVWNQQGGSPNITTEIDRVSVLFGAEEEPPIVPEPTSIAIWSLIGLGLAGFGYYRVRRKN